MPRPAPPKYRTTNRSEYNTALKNRGSLDVWFDPGMAWFAAPDGRAGRPLRFSERGHEFCLTLKGLFQLPLRQVTGLTQTLPDLLGQIPEDETILSVGGTSAYDTRNCHAAIAGRGAVPVIPVRRNGKAWIGGGPGVEARNETLRAMKQLGRATGKKWSGYHRRSLVKTKMHCFKLLGQRLCARTFDRQITELKVRAAILNRFSQIGMRNTIRIV